MIGRIKTMNLTNFKDDDVSIATGQFRMAIKRLDVLNKVPVEINRNIVDVLQMLYIVKLNLFFSTANQSEANIIFEYV